jgi:uncharacterized protein YbjT (DUF2867 family)
MIPRNVVHVVGASGRSGAALVRALPAAGMAVQPVARDLGRWNAVAPPAHELLSPPRMADLRDTRGMGAALCDATCIVSTAHARTTPLLLAAAPAAARLVLLGSTRRFTKWPDAHGEGVRAGEAALLGSGRPGIMLHPTMIYGAIGENNVQRLAALLRRLPLVPLPGGGRALVQPIHQDDVTRAIIAAIAVAPTAPLALVIAGPAALPYADFVRAVAAAAGLGPPRIVPVPLAALMALAPLTAALPFVPRVGVAEIRRLTEDKAFDIAPMSATLGVRPIPLEAGLALTFRR